MRSFTEDRLQRLAEAAGHEVVAGLIFGIEKESLRVDPRGGLAQTPHPKALGSALTHPYITTDYSEALLELITPPLASAEAVLRFLNELHRYVYAHMDDEYLWATSMPCILAGEESVPIANYGASNAGRMKHVYRVGLGYRYGRVMQSISGVHFNFSFRDELWDALQRIAGDPQPRKDFVSEGYFGLIRNLQRLGWLVPYLFGASPAVCKSFLHNRDTNLQTFDASTYYGAYATSLRMGDIGYQNNKEHEVGIKACYDSLDEYVDTLTYAVTTPYPGYEKIGVKVNGEYRQLNANILQIENEYYTTVRPKQVPEWLEKPSLALKRRGVRYVELRSLDVNAYEPLGVGETQIYFLHALMLYCLIEDSPRITTVESAEIDRNEMIVAHRGRLPGVRLMRNGSEVALSDWASETLDRLEPICRLLDKGESEGPYGKALKEQRAAVADPERTPSARMLAEMRERGESFHQFARRMSLAHRRYFRSQPGSSELTPHFDALAQKSLEEQRRLEAEDSLSFDDFLTSYFSQK